MREVPPSCGGPSSAARSGSCSGSSSRKPITSRPYSGRRPSFRAISEPTCPAPTISVRSRTREAAAHHRPRDRAGRQQEGDRDRPEEPRQPHARRGDRGRVEHEHADPRRQGHEQDHAGHIVGGRPHRLELVVQVEAVALGEEHPGTEDADSEGPDGRVGQVDLGPDEVDEHHCGDERRGVGEQQDTPKNPAAAATAVAREGRIGDARCGLRARRRVRGQLLLNVRQIARQRDLRTVQPRGEDPSDHHRPKDPGRSPTTSRPHVLLFSLIRAQMSSIGPEYRPLKSRQKQPIVRSATLSTRGLGGISFHESTADE